MTDLKYTQIKSLCKYYSLTPRELVESMAEGDYQLMSLEDAESAAQESIGQMLWAFSPRFLAGYTGIDISIFELLADKREDANEAILSLIESNGSLQEFADEAIVADGLGYFLSSYGGDYFELPGSDLISWRVK